MRKTQRIGVIIPALNEEQAIGKVIADIPDWTDRIVVVDNGSSDRTRLVAQDAGATVVEERELGYGAACLRGMRELSEMDIIVFLDGDHSDYPQDMVMLVDPIVAGEAQLVLGARRGARIKPGSLTPQQRFGNWLACTLMHLIWGTSYTDLGPFRAIDAKALKDLKMADRNYGWTIEMQIKAALAGLETREVEVGYRPRIGQSKVSGTLKGTMLAGFKILGLIARYAATHGPWLTRPA